MGWHDDMLAFIAEERQLIRKALREIGGDVFSERLGAQDRVYHEAGFYLHQHPGAGEDPLSYVRRMDDALELSLSPAHPDPEWVGIYSMRVCKDIAREAQRTVR